VSILFPNAPVHFACRCASHSSAAFSLSHLTCDVLGQWLWRYSHSIRSVANVEIIIMHKDPIVYIKEPNEIEIV
jgi:hypothetical protein